MDVPMMDAPGTSAAAVAAVDEIPFRPPTYKDGNIRMPDGTYNQVIDDPGTPYRPGVDAVEAVPAQRVPVDVAGVRRLEVQSWMKGSSAKEMSHLLNGGTVQINGKPFTHADLLDFMGDTTVKPVAGGAQFAPNTLENLSSRRPMSGPQWLQDLRRKLPGTKRTPPGVLDDVAGSLHGTGSASDIDVPQNSWRGKFGRNPLLRKASHLPWILGLIAELAESRRTEGKH
jgi:hypothetical protein